VWAFSGVAKTILYVAGRHFASNSPEWKFLWKAMSRTRVIHRTFHIPFNALFNVARTQSKRKNVCRVKENVDEWEFTGKKHL
jgi:hypothetical protein